VQLSGKIVLIATFRKASIVQSLLQKPYKFHTKNTTKLTTKKINQKNKLKNKIAKNKKKYIFN
jgi:hypothetical protein